MEFMTTNTKALFLLHFGKKMNQAVALAYRKLIITKWLIFGFPNCIK